MRLDRNRLLGLLLPLLCAAGFACAPAQAQIAFRGATSATGPATGAIAFRAATSAAGGNISFRAAANSGTPTTLAPVFRQVASATAASGVLTLAINRPAGTLENDVMIAAIAVRPSSATITAPPGWTLVRRTDNPGPTDSNSLAVYYRVAGGNEPLNYAWSFSASTGAAGGIQAFSSVDTTSPIDVEAGAATVSGLAHAAPGITTTANGAMVVAHFTKSGAGTWTPPVAGGGMPAFTESFDVQVGAAGAGQSLEGTRALQPAAGATGAKTATASANADAGVTHILALRPALRIPVPAGVAPNDLLLAAVAVAPDTAVITPPAGWTLVRRTDNALANANSLAVYRRFAGTTEPTSYVFGVSGGTAWVGGMQAYSGVDMTTPIDLESGVATVSALTHTAPSITTTVANAMVVTHHSMASSATWTPPPAGGGMPVFTERIDVASLAVANANGVSMESAQALRAAIAATGTKTATASANADAGNAHILALRPSAQLINVARPGTAVQNDIMIAAIGFAPDTAVITPPADWTLIRRIDNGAGPGTNNSLAVYRKVHAATEPGSYTWTFSANVTVAGGIQAYSGVDIANPIDLENGVATPSALTHTAPSITTTVANAMVVTNHTMNGAATWTPPIAGGGMPAFTESFDVNTGGAGAGQTLEGARALRAVAGATGAKTATANANADKGNAHILALRPLPTTQFDIPTPPGTLANDVLITAIAFTPETAVINPTVPADWTLIRRINQAGGGGTNSSLAVYRRLAIAGEPAAHGWTFGAAPTAIAGGIQGFSGVDTVTPVDIENGQNTASALTHATPSVVTTVANTMLVTANAYASSGTWTPPTGMAESYDRANLATPNAAGVSVEGSRVEQVATGATGAKTATAVGNADKGNAHIVALRPAAVVAAAGGFNAYDTATGAGLITGFIRTKIAGAAVSLDIIALNPAKTAILTTFTGTVRVEVLNSSDNSGALDANGCRPSWATIQTLSPDITLLAGDNGRKTISFTVANSFKDARLRITYPAGAPTTTGCSNDRFAIRPNTFGNFSVTDNDWQTAGTTRTLNETVFTAGTLVHKAGRPFTVRADAQNAAGVPVVTTNYSDSPTATLTACAGAACTATFGTLTLVTAFTAGQLNTGVASYSEVGSFRLQLADSSFSGVDATDPGSTAAERDIVSAALDVGRFVPDHFAVSLNTPQFDAACVAGSFTYVGQAFNYTTLPASSPVMTVTAQDFANNATALYAGAWARITNSTLTPATQALRYSRFDALGGGTTPALDPAGLPLPAADPTISAFAAGVGTLTFSSGTGLKFIRSTTTPNAPFNAEIALALDVIDTDGVAFAGNPASFGTATAGNGIAFSGGKGMRFGVLKLDNAYGSELLQLRVPVRAMYWNGSGWVTNVDDSCTTLPNQRDNLAIGNHLGTLTAVNYGSGKVPSAGLTLGGGRGTIVLAAPNAGTSGSADIALNLNPAATTIDVSCNTTHPATISGANLPWLQGKWGGSIACPSTLYDRDPGARIKFGSPKAPYIYLRERY